MQHTFTYNISHPKCEDRLYSKFGGQFHPDDLFTYGTDADDTASLPNTISGDTQVELTITNFKISVVFDANFKPWVHVFGKLLDESNYYFFFYFAIFHQKQITFFSSNSKAF